MHSSTVQLRFDDLPNPKIGTLAASRYAPGLERPKDFVSTAHALGVIVVCELSLHVVGQMIPALARGLRRFRKTDMRCPRRAAELAVRAAHCLAVSRGSRSRFPVNRRRTTPRRRSTGLRQSPAIKNALLDLMIRLTRSSTTMCR